MGSSSTAKICAAHRAEIAALIDPARSGVIAGTPHVFMPGEGQVMNAFCLRPAKGKHFDACQSHWRTEHLEVAASIGKTEIKGDQQPLKSYAQFHANTEASRTIAEALGVAQADFLGAARSFTNAPHEINSRMKSKEVETIALPDERNFIDHERSFMALYGSP